MISVISGRESNLFYEAEKTSETLWKCKIWENTPRATRKENMRLSSVANCETMVVNMGDKVSQNRTAWMVEFNGMSVSDETKVKNLLESVNIDQPAITNKTKIMIGEIFSRIKLISAC